MPNTYYTENKNFDVRLKAAIDIRLKRSGLMNLALGGSNGHEFGDAEKRFFESLDECTLEYLKAFVPAPTIDIQAIAEEKYPYKVGIRRFHTDNERSAFIAGAQSSITPQEKKGDMPPHMKKWFDENYPVQNAQESSKGSDAVDFAEWILKNGYDSRLILVSPCWSKSALSETYKSSELYQLFLSTTPKEESTD